VRDAHTSQLVAPLSPSAPVQVVDPVFLCDFDQLISSKPPVTEPYLLVFGDFSGKLDAPLRAIIAATGLKTIISLQYPCAAATNRVAAPSPEEWLSYFKHAAFVVTTYFHGTAIAAKFERPFIAIPSPGRRIKVATMLDWMGLRSRCFMEAPSPKEAEALAREPIDWLEPRRQVAQSVEKSKAFLEMALR
jgi:hypothetical protein